MIADLTRWLMGETRTRIKGIFQNKKNDSSCTNTPDLKAVQTGTIIVPKTPKIMEQNVYRFGNDLEWILLKKYDWDIIMKRLVELGDTLVINIKDGEELK